MSDVPGAWALLFVARALRGERSAGVETRRPANDHRAVRKGWFGGTLCRFGFHAWSLASPRYFVCTRCGKTKGM